MKINAYSKGKGEIEVEHEGVNYTLPLGLVEDLAIFLLKFGYIQVNMTAELEVTRMLCPSKGALNITRRDR